MNSNTDALYKWYRKKRQRFMEILLIINPHKPPIHIKLPYWLLRITCFFGGALLLFTFVFVINYYLAQDKLKKAENLEYVNRYQEQKIGTLEQKTKELEEKLNQLTLSEQEIRNMAGIEEKKKPISVSRSLPVTGYRGFQMIHSSFDGNLGELASEIDKLEVRLDEKMKDYQELKQEIAARMAYLAALPNKWPLSGRVTSTFGYRRSPFGKKTEFHDGLDIANRTGSLIVAAGSGVVVFTGYKSGYGKTVVISHGYGFKTYYCHTSTILVKTGELVKKGQGIARVGSTGRSTGPHLHFMVEERGQLVNPDKYLGEN